MAFQPLSRRTALKGLGVSIALPFLEVMTPRAKAAGAAVGNFPRRLVFVYFPNGVWMDAWKSSGEGRDFTLQRRDGVVRVPELPGIGIEIDRDVLMRFKTA